VETPDKIDESEESQHILLAQPPNIIDLTELDSIELQRPPIIEAWQSVPHILEFPDPIIVEQNELHIVLQTPPFIEELPDPDIILNSPPLILLKQLELTIHEHLVLNIPAKQLLLVQEYKDEIIELLSEQQFFESTDEIILELM